MEIPSNTIVKSHSVKFLQINPQLERWTTSRSHKWSPHRGKCCHHLITSCVSIGSRSNKRNSGGIAHVRKEGEADCWSAIKRGKLRQCVKRSRGEICSTGLNGQRLNVFYNYLKESSIRGVTNQTGRLRKWNPNNYCSISDLRETNKFFLMRKNKVSLPGSRLYLHQLSIHGRSTRY